MGRSPRCQKVRLKKGPWTPEEDQKLLAFIDQHVHGSWRALPDKAGLQRCGKSCRLRWKNYLRPDIKRGKFSLQEEQTIIQLHALLGNRWSAIATHLPKRTDNEIKNYWNTHLKKRLTKMGIDPVTHKPCSGSLCATTGLSHMAQWESARLQAEARLVRESKLLSSATATNNPPQLSRPPCLDVLKAWQAQLAMLSSSPSCSSGITNEAAFSVIMALNGDNHLESPTSTLAFPYPMMTTTMVENAMILQESKNIIPILPLNNNDDDDMYENGSAWFGATGVAVAGNDEVNNDHVTGVGGFSDFTARQYEQWSIIGETHSNNVGENYVGNNNNQRGIDAEQNKNYWNNIHVNLVTINASSASSLQSGSSPSRAVF